MLNRYSKRIKLLPLLLVLFASPAQADRLHPEKWYQDQWCEGRGVTEYVLPDRTRVDCLTDTHAIEVEFANKYKEAPGQAIHYSRLTGKKPGIVLIMEKESDRRYLKNLQADLAHAGLLMKIWTIKL